MLQNRYFWKKLEFVDEVFQEINKVVVATATEYYRDINKCVPEEV